MAEFQTSLEITKKILKKPEPLTDGHIKNESHNHDQSYRTHMKPQITLFSISRFQANERITQGLEKMAVFPAVDRLFLFFIV